MSRRWWTSALLAIGGATLAVLAMRQQSHNGHPWTFLVSDFVPGVSMMGSGLFIRARRPHNRSWWLIFLAGVAWYIGDFEHSFDVDVGTFGFSFGRWYDVLLGWVVLAFPTGRLQQWWTRALTIALLGLGAIRTLSRLFLFVPADSAGYGSKNRFLPITDDQYWRFVEDAYGRALAITMVLVWLSVVHRWIRSSRPGRQMLSPAMFAASVLAAALVYEYLVGWSTRLVGDGWVRIFYVVWWAHAVLAVSLALGLTRLVRTRSAVVDVVAGLGHGAPLSRFADALAKSLGDDQLRLSPWSPELEAFVDEDGTVVSTIPQRPERAVTVIERDGVPLASLEHDVALLEDPGLVDAVAAATRLTIDNEQLRVEVERQLVEVEASRTRILEAGDAERRRIERNLHDGAQQRLVAIALGLRLADGRLGADATPAVRQVLTDTVRALGDAVGELRDLARGIHPASLAEFGLEAAIESLADRSPLPISVDVQLSSEPPSAVAATAYFAVSEALTNVYKHAIAHTVSVQIAMRGDGMCIAVVDDGVGGADAGDGSGLRGIADRVATVGGSLQLFSPVGGGTRFEVELPCASS